MKTLSPLWLLEGLIDYEYKKYIVLDYLQRVEIDFKKKKIYPHVDDVSNHLSFILQLKHSKSITTNVFPDIPPSDIIKFNFKYNNLICDPDSKSHLEKIINFSLPKFRSIVMDSSNIKRNLFLGMDIEGVGHISTDISTGYVIIPKNKMHVYSYAIYEVPNQQGDLFEYMPERYVTLKKVKVYDKDVTPMEIKMDLMIQNNHPNMSLFMVSSQNRLPLKECYLPLVKDLIIENLY